MSGENIINIKNLTKNFGKNRGISDVTLSIKPGEVFGFLGPNGAGKSTTINCMLGLLKPSSGEIYILNQNVTKNSVFIHKNIGYLAGDTETDPNLTGDQYIEYAANLRGGYHLFKKRIAVFKRDLEGDTAKKIKHMSRGNKQKIGLITALMHDPDLLILDEPTSGLDPLMQETFNQIIIDHSKRGKSTFISSHILSEVESICHRVGFIRDGKLISVDSLENLRKKSTKYIQITIVQTNKLKSEIEMLRNVADITVIDNTIGFTYNDNINTLIQLLSNYKIEDIIINDSDLEQMFLEYYQENKSHV